jgi:hypothetical protein
LVWTWVQVWARHVDDRIRTLRDVVRDRMVVLQDLRDETSMGE